MVVVVRREVNKGEKGRKKTKENDGGGEERDE